MQSGYPCNQGGIFPAFQYQSNFYVSQKNNESPALVCCADGMQTNMVANQFPGGLGMACSPVQMRQGLAQTGQKFHRLHHLQTRSPHNPKALSFTVGSTSTALQRNNMELEESSSGPESRKEKTHSLLYALLKEDSQMTDTTQSLINTQPCLSAKTNGTIEYNSSHLHDERYKSLQEKWSLASSNYGQTRKPNLDHLEGVNVTCPQLQDFSHQLSGPSLNAPPTDEQILCYIEKRLAAASNQQGGRHGATPLSKKWNFCSKIGDTVIQSDCNIPNFNSVLQLPSTPQSNAENGKRQGLTFSLTEKCTARGERAFKKDISKSRNKKISTGTLAPALQHSQHAPKNISIKNNESIGYDLPVKKHLDAYENLVYSDVDKMYVGSINEKLPRKLGDYIEKAVFTHYSITALKDLITSLECAEIMAKVDNFSEVVLQQYWNGDIGNINLFTSTEYPQIMKNIAATCTKNEDASPVVLTAVSGMPFHMAPKKSCSSNLVNCSSMQEEYRAPWLNISKSLNDSRTPISTSEQKNGEMDPKAEETVKMYGVKNAIVAFQTTSISVASENDKLQLKSLITKDAKTKKGENDKDVQRSQLTNNDVTAHSRINSSVQIRNILSVPSSQRCEDTRKSTHSVYLQSELGVTLSEDKVKEPDLRFHALNHLKDSQYEDISDDEGSSRPMTNQPCIQDLNYKYLSKVEKPQIKNIALETKSIAQVPENNNVQSTFEYVVNQAQMEVTSDEKLIPKKQHVAQQSSTVCTSFAEHDGFEHLSSSKCNPAKAKQTVSYSPSYVIKESETDNQMDGDDWVVIPLSMVDIQFEPKEPDDEHGDIELVVLHPGKTELVERWDDTSPNKCRLHQPFPEPGLPSAPSNIEVFDTVASFVQAKSELFGTFKSASSNELDPDAEPNNAPNRRESYSDSEDSCETEDSCDYSSALEHNRLAVDKRLLKEMSIPATPDMCGSLSEEETEHKSEIAQTRTPGLLEIKESFAQSRQTITERSDIIILDSDTDDESHQICKAKARRKRSFYPGSEEDMDSLRDGSGHLIETRVEQVKHVNRPNVSPQQIVINLDSDTDSSDSEDRGDIRKRGQVIQAREHIQREINRPTTSERTVFHKVVEEDHICKKTPTLDRICLSGSDESSSTSFAELDFATETASSTSERPQMFSFKDSSDKLPQSVGKNADRSKGDTLALKTPTTTKSATGNERHWSTNYNLPSTFISNPTSTTPARMSHVRQRSASDGLSPSGCPKDNTRTSVSTQQSSSSKLKRSHSYSNTSPLEHSDIVTKDLSPATTESFARKRVRDEWNTSYFPTRRDRTAVLETGEPPRTGSCDSCMKERPCPSHKSGVHRRRHRSNKLATPLMKKTKLEAIQRTKDINRTTSSGKSDIGKHYKWANEQRSTKVASSWKQNRH